MYAYSHFVTPNVANHSTDRIIALKPRDDKRGTALFAKNKLHAVQDAGLWYLKFESGELPEPLKQRFTSFNVLIKYLTNYFNMRGIDIEEVIS